MLEHLVERYGWDGLGTRIAIRSFTHDPSINSSLKFLRKTPWAREKVESLYVHSATHPRKTPRRATVEESSKESAEDATADPTDAAGESR
jgi:uncharacterized protein (DUF2132 family)